MKPEKKDHQLFNRIAYDYSKKDYVKSSSIARKFILETALEQVLISNKHLGTVIEPGCGLGASAKYLAGKYTRYIGIDQSENLIEMAEKYNSDLSNVEFIASNVKEVKAYNGVADTILLSGALHHMTHLDNVMSNLKSMAKENCSVVAIEPHCHNQVINILRKMRVYVDKSYSADQIFFKEQELVDLFKRNHLKDINVRYISYFSQPFAQVIFPPQFLSLQLSRLSLLTDSFLHKINFLPFNRLSFLLVIQGTF